MKFYSINGRLVSRNINSKRIEWGGDSRSKFQREIKNLLMPIWGAHIVFEEFPVYGSRLSIDFLNATKNVAIEVQGGQHIKHTPFFQRGKQEFLYQLQRDMTKQKFCEMNGIALLEIFPEDLKDLLSGKILIANLIQEVEK